jgi:DNA-binding XRE family transcriptional regulator
MIADAIGSLAKRPRFTVEVFPGTGEYFEVGSEDQATLTALLLRRARQRAGLSLAQVAQRLGATSINAYARYEHGRSIPTVQKLSQLFSAVTSHRDLVVIESEA